ncbi:MAG: hypothetical protein Kow0090_14040 [Myxococcota bacterium]
MKSDEKKYPPEATVRKGRILRIEPFTPTTPESREVVWLRESYLKPFASLLAGKEIAPSFGFAAGTKKRLGNYARFLAVQQTELEFIPLDIFGKQISDEELSHFLTPGLYKDYGAIKRSARVDDIKGSGVKVRMPDITALSLRLGFKNSLIIELESPEGALRQAAKRWLDYLKTLEYSEINIVRLSTDPSGKARRSIVSGMDFVIERIANMNIRVSAGNNPHYNPFAVEKVAAYLHSFDPDDPGNRAVVCGDGAGVYSLAVAGKFPKTVALALDEISEKEIAYNARLNGFSNVRIERNIELVSEIGSQVELAVLSELLSFKNSEKLFYDILELHPLKIVLLSLSPQTMKETLSAAFEKGYDLKQFYIFEYIPVEKIALFAAMMERV